jgi:hypothetical protein
MMTIGHQQRSVIMALWKDLLFSDFGFLSVITIFVAGAVVGFCAYLFIKKAAAAEKAERERLAKLPPGQAG